MNSTSKPALLRLLGDHTWQEHAACGSADDPDLFFPEPDEADRITAAKTFCGPCDVRHACLDAALEGNDRWGIRGGLTEEEREPLHRDLPRRLDPARVEATLAGRDVHLTAPERQAVARKAYAAGIPTTRLAWILKITEEHAAKLYRRTRREMRHRTLAQPTPSSRQAKSALSQDDVEAVA
jgi:WhiB family transcriptional regulator, redox-sensing transcriptional regulator